MKYAAVLMLLTFCLSFCAQAAAVMTEPKFTAVENNTPQKLLIDTDPGRDDVPVAFGSEEPLMYKHVFP